MIPSQLSTYQEYGIGNTPTLVSSAAIFPQDFLTLVSGNSDISTIVPPIEGYHLLGLIFTDPSPGSILDSGNILVAITPTTDALILLCYNPFTKKYYPTASTGGGGGGTPGSPTTSIQFNAGGGNFGGSANLEWINADAAVQLEGVIRTGDDNLDNIKLQAYDVDMSTYRTFATLTAGSVPSLAIATPSGGFLTIVADLLTVAGLAYPTADGSAGEVLTTDGSGNLTFQPAGGSGSPGGSDTQVQYNNSGAFGGSALLTLVTASDILSLKGQVSTGLTNFVLDATAANGFAEFTIKIPANRDGLIRWLVDGNTWYIMGVNQGNADDFFLYSALTSKFVFHYGGAAGTDNVFRTAGAFQPEVGYNAVDNTAGISAGPFTTISSITVKDGLVTALTGS